MSVLSDIFFRISWEAFCNQSVCRSLYPPSVNADCRAQTCSQSNRRTKFQCDSLSAPCIPGGVNNPAVFCTGYAFLLFQDESSVQALIDACIEEDGKLYLCVSSPTIKDKPVSGNTHKRTHAHISCSLLMNSVELAVTTLSRLYKAAQRNLSPELKPVGFVCDRSRSAHGTWTTAILWWMDLSPWTRGKPYLWEVSLVHFVQVSLIFI